MIKYTLPDKSGNLERLKNNRNSESFFSNFSKVRGFAEGEFFTTSFFIYSFVIRVIKDCVAKVLLAI